MCPPPRLTSGPFSTQDDASLGKGLFYVYVQILLQLAIAMLTGLLYATPHSGAYGVIISLLLFQGIMCFWVMVPTANDVFGAMDTTIGYLAEFISTSLVFASNLVADFADGDPAKLGTALGLASTAANIMVWSCFVPMLLTAYDSFIVPIVMIFWKSELGVRETLCQMLITLVLLPMSLASSLFGFGGGGNAEAMLGELEGALVGLAAEGDGGDDEDEEGATGEDVEAGVGKEAARAAEAAELAEAQAKAAALVAAAAAAEIPKATPNKAALKRLKRAEMLARVRAAGNTGVADAAGAAAIDDDSKMPHEWHTALAAAEQLNMQDKVDEDAGQFRRKDLRAVFTQFDADSSGAVSITEMANICEALHLERTEEQLSALMKESDPDGSGAIDFEVCRAWLHGRMGPRVARVTRCCPRTLVVAHLHDAFTLTRPTGVCPSHGQGRPHEAHRHS